jgi:glucose/arabinose dehydrogenase
MTREVPRLTPLSLIVLLLLLSLSPPVSAATVRTGFAETQVASGLLTPTAMAFAPDGRLFVCQKGGQLRVIKDGVLLATPFVSLTVDSSGERGLLGVAFDPGFASKHFVYVHYTATTPTIHNRVSRLPRTATSP